MAQTHRHNHGHGDSVTNSAQWGRVGENPHESSKSFVGLLTWQLLSLCGFKSNKILIDEYHTFTPKIARYIIKEGDGDGQQKKR